MGDGKPNTSGGWYCISKTYVGVILVLISALIFSLMTLLVQATGERGIPSFEMMVVRCFLQMLYSGFWCLWIDINPFGTKGNRVLPFLRGFLGPLCAGSLYYGATHISISDATVLFFSSPIWTPFVARVFLGEKFRFVNFIAIIVGFAGVIFIVQPNFIFGYLPSFGIQGEEPTHDESEKAQPGSLQYTISATVCLVGAMFAAGVYAVIRKSGGSVKFQWLLITYFWFCSVVSSFVLLLIFQGLPVITHDPVTILLLGLLSLCGCLGQTTLNKGAQMIDASKTSVLRNADIAFVLVWQIFLLGELPTVWSTIGLVLICACTILIAVTKPSPTPVATEPADIDLEELEDLADVSLDPDVRIEVEKPEP